MMAKANKAIAANERNAEEFFPLNDLPNDLLVSVFAAAKDPIWVRHTFPCVCPAWNELYLSEDASPLHATLEVDFEKEIATAAAAAAARERRRRDHLPGAPPPPPTPLFDLSRVTEWARGRARSVRKLVVRGLGRGSGTLDAEKAEAASSSLGALLAVVGPSLTELTVSFGALCNKKPFWEALRENVVPAGRLRSFAVLGCVDYVSFGPYLESLGQHLAGSLEELVLYRPDCSCTRGLPRFPESFCSLTKLRRFQLRGHPEIKAIPAGISSLQSLKALALNGCDLSSLPKELGELSGLTELNLRDNRNLGSTERVPRVLEILGNLFSDLVSGNGRLQAADETLPAELAGMTSLRVLDLHATGLRTFPSFICKLKSLESLTLCCNSLSSLPKELGELSRLTKLILAGNDLGASAAAIPAELAKIKSLRHLYIDICGLGTFPAALVGALEPLEVLDLRFNAFEVDAAALAALLRHCGPRLREVRLSRSFFQLREFASPWTAESLANLEAFKERVLAENPGAKVTSDYKELYDPNMM